MTEFSYEKREPLEELEVNKVLSLADNVESPLMIGSHAISEDYLIVKSDSNSNKIFVINTDSTPKFPICLEYDLVCAAIIEGVLDIIKMRWPREVFKLLDELPDTKRQRAQGRIEAIKPLTDDLEATLENSHGEKLFQKVIEKTGKSKQHIYDCFNAYLYYGQRPAGLALPIGKNIFHEPKETREIRVKLGRPARLDRGKVLDNYDYNAFKKAKRWYVQKNGPTLKAVYKRLMREEYYESKEKHSPAKVRSTGEKYRVQLKHRTARPSGNQFYYWLLKEYDGNIPRRDKSRQNKIENKKDIAGRTGDANTNIIAAGQVFELDESPFDEELVSVFDPTRRTKVGKGTLYFIIDKFTKLIAGVFITTDAPSFNTVRQALFAAARDKKQFIEERGLNAEAINWTQRGIPTTLFVDNAEFRNRKSEGAVFDLAVTVKFARRGRGDDKPNVEQLFRIFSQYFRGMSKAHQTKSLQDIATQVARKHAMLTIDELYIIAIVYINYHNNHREIVDYPSERSMIQDKVPAIPAKLWAWSQRFRPGYLLHYPDEELYMKLLAKGMVSVQQEGIKLAETGHWYNCEWTLNNYFQEKKPSRNKAIPMVCRYNPNFVDLIFIDTDDGLKPATLDERHKKAFSGLSFEQVKQQKELMKTASEKEQDVQLEYELGVYEVMENIFKDAKKEKLPGPMPRLATIKDNRKLEALIDRFSDTNQFLQAYRATSGERMDSQLIDESEGAHSVHNEFDEED
jgi:hypothetical protein